MSWVDVSDCHTYFTNCVIGNRDCDFFVCVDGRNGYTSSTSGITCIVREPAGKSIGCIRVRYLGPLIRQIKLATRDIDGIQWSIQTDWNQLQPGEWFDVTPPEPLAGVLLEEFEVRATTDYVEGYLEMQVQGPDGDCGPLGPCAYKDFVDTSEICAT